MGEMKLYCDGECKIEEPGEGEGELQGYLVGWLGRYFKTYMPIELD